MQKDPWGQSAAKINVPKVQKSGVLITCIMDRKGRGSCAKHLHQNTEVVGFFLNHAEQEWMETKTNKKTVTINLSVIIDTLRIF